MTAPEERVTTIDLLRHGACVGGEIYRGRTDVPLSEQGWQQMEQATNVGIQWQRIVSSPLLRCREFAQRIAGHADLQVQIVDALQEMDFGDWEGKLLRDVWQADPDLVSRFYADPQETTPPGGEPVVDALERVVGGWQSILEKNAGQTVLLVCHGGVIRMLLCHLLDLPLKSMSQFHIPYAARTRIKVFHRETGDYAVLMSLNAAGEDT